MARRDKTQSASQAFRGAGGILKANRRTYAVGMEWLSVTEARNVTAQAKDAATREGADLFCLRGKIQLGLGSMGTGHKPGMQSLAALLADTLEGNFIGVFDVGDGYYFVAARDGQVLAGCDRLYENADAAKDTFQDLLDSQAWQQKFAPKNWEEKDCKSEMLDDIVSGKKTSSKLQPTSSRGSVLKMGAILALVAVGAGGYYAYDQYQEEQKQADAAEQIRQAATIRANLENERRKVTIPIMPHVGKPLAVPALALCVNEILAAPISVAGWSPVSITCSPAASGGKVDIVLALRRDGGTINWVGPSLNREGFRPSVSIRDGGVRAAWTSEKSAQVYQNGDKNMVDTGRLSDANRYLTAQFEEVFTPITLKEDNGQTISQPGPKNTTTTVVVERHLAFSFKTRHDPKDFLDILAPLKADTIGMVQLDPVSWTWTVEGNIYEQVPLPQQGQAALPPAPAPR